MGQYHINLQQYFLCRMLLINATVTDIKQSTQQQTELYLKHINVQCTCIFFWECGATANIDPE